MKDRITLLIKAKNLTAAQFADEIGVQKSSISHIISGRNNASLDFIQKVLLCYPEVNMDWLMFGKGPLFKGSDFTLNASNDNSLNAASTLDLAHVDLFSELIPGKGPDFRKENDLSMAPAHEENLNQGEIEIKASITNTDKKENIPGFNFGYPENKIVNTGHKNNSTKSIVKIVEFYSDNTFREYSPE